jgi:uncharacterized membrane protein
MKDVAVRVALVEQRGAQRHPRLLSPFRRSDGWACSRHIDQPGGTHMKAIEESIEIEVPVSTAYNQWTQFESFPQFMDGIERVEQKDDKHLHWVAEIAGDKREWDAEITEQHPDHRVAWKAIDQEGPNGIVTFQKLDEGRTKVMVHMDYDPEGVAESIGSFVGLDSRRVEGDLERFKEFIEGRAHETGAWRGNIEEN